MKPSRFAAKLPWHGVTPFTYPFASTHLVILFVSDMHFGRGPAADERAKEEALIDCLQAQADRVEALYLVGDVFDEYIEYRTLVPKGFVRFQALLADWTDRGVPVTYLVGNHDPWHRDYFERELGIRVLFGATEAQHEGWTIHMAHGDGQRQDSRLYHRLKPILRHPLPVWLYRTLLPGDAGLRLARWVNRRVSHQEVKPATARILRDYARALLRETETNVVIFGHSHQPEHTIWPEGTYVNLGAWHGERTFARLCNGEITLLRWNGERAVAVDSGSAVIEGRKQV